VPRFAVAALVRRDPALHGRPLAVLTGTPATRAVVEASAEAGVRGVRPGMGASEALARAPGLVCHDRDPEAERSAAGALLDAALGTSPRLMAAAPDCVFLDLAGLDGLFGPAGSDVPEAAGRRRRDQMIDARIGERLATATAEVGLPASVGIAGSRTVATLAARTAAGVTVVPPGGAAAFLAPLPVGCLDPEPDLAESLERWGIRALGELAALPAAGLLARLGPRGTRLQSRARGQDDAPFVAWVPPEPCVEAVTLDWEVTALEGLAFVLRGLLERLAARLAARGCGATALTLVAGLADGAAHRRRLPLIAPLREPRTLLALLRTDLEGLRLEAPIVALALEAEPASLHPLQADLFVPPRPSPRELGETLGRLAALVGPDRVGAPALGDSHRPDAIGVTAFTGSVAHRAAVAALALLEPARLTCRRFTPPLPAAVEVRNESPARVEAAGVRGPVVACAGPWRTAGEWWAETAWAWEEWDVALADGAVYRLALDQATGAWTVTAVYD